MNSKISVIVPIYKVEKYLCKCVDSIINQTYKNLEIILVDDGSPDNCPQICDDYAKKDSRIKVVHKENGGLSDARNAGMKVATGEYVSFIDSDDFIDESFIECLHSAILDADVKLSACDYRLYYDGDDLAKSDVKASVCVETAEEAINDILNNRKIRAVAWNKMFHKDLLKGELFPVGKYHEDEFFSYRIIHKAQKIAYVDSKLYYYLQRQGSIMASFNIKHLDVLDAGLERLVLLNEYYPSLCKCDKLIFCAECVQLYREALKSKCDKKKVKKIIVDKRKKVTITFDEFKTFSLKEKIYCIAGRYCLGMFAYIINIIGR